MLIKINSLQRKMAWFKLPNFMFYIILFSTLIYFAEVGLRVNSKNMLFFSVLEFNKAAILRGEFWRIFTYVFLIPKVHFVLAFLYIYILNFVGNSLEAHWGAANLTIYYFLGFVLTTLIGFVGGTTNIVFLNLSLIFVFVAIYPNMSLNLFSFFNVKAGWLGGLTATLFAVKFVISLIIFNLSNLLAEAVSILLFLMFFGPSYFINLFKSVKRFMNRQHF